MIRSMDLITSKELLEKESVKRNMLASAVNHVKANADTEGGTPPGD